MASRQIAIPSKPTFNDIDAFWDIEQHLDMHYDYKEQYPQSYSLRLIRLLSKLHIHQLRNIAETYCNGLAFTSNKSYYVGHVGYRIINELDVWNDRCQKNWEIFSVKTPQEIVDTYTRENIYMKEKAKKKKKEKAEKKAPTVTGTIVEYFKKGGTRKGCAELLEKTFPERQIEKMKKTLQVQLSFHIPKKYKVVQKEGSDIIKLKEKE